jgi:hypothetical protein
MRPQVQVADNGDIDPAPGSNWRRLTPEGCCVSVLSDDTGDTTLVVMCQCLDQGNPWEAYLLFCPTSGALERLAGGLISYKYDRLCYAGLAEQLAATPAEWW